MFEQIDCPEAQRLVESGAQLVDVRGPDEYAQGALPGAKNIPVQVMAQQAGELEEHKPVVLYCATGARSTQAQMLLQQLGFAEVYNLGSIQKYYDC
ncbi:MAG: rhodanese-like domain-containing protein [Desulfohalobiaceae bacterium]